MQRLTSLRLALVPSFALLLSAGCFEDPAVSNTTQANTDETGDGDGDPTTGDGDGDPSTGDGDGDPSTGDGDGDGDGDPTTGDGDGDPTTGDGDGDPTTGDGDGDPPEPIIYSFSDSLCDAEITSWTANQPTNIACEGAMMPAGWARTHDAFMVETAGVMFMNALEMATHNLSDGLIQAGYKDLDFSAATQPILRTRAACSPVAACSVWWQIVIREVGNPAPLGFVEGTQIVDDMYEVIEFDLTPHKDKILNITLIMTNDDVFNMGDILTFEDPRVVDAG